MDGNLQDNCLRVSQEKHISTGMTMKGVGRGLPHPGWRLPHNAAESVAILHKTKGSGGGGTAFGLISLPENKQE
jgi:hypothetical protein